MCSKVCNCTSQPFQLLRYNTETVSSEVLSRMKQQISDVHSTGSHSFLLDDDATLPFAASDVLNAMDDKVCGVYVWQGWGSRREVLGRDGVRQ